MDLRTSPATRPVPGDPIARAAAVAVETLLLGARDGRLTCRVFRQDLSGSEHPDAAALRLAGFADGGRREGGGGEGGGGEGEGGGGGGGGGILHSTSWRFAAGQIVLTYAALPDPDPRGAAVVEPALAPAGGGDPLVPSPPRVEQAEVVEHACRHLAFLRRTDPIVALASAEQYRIWALLDAYRPDVAGQRV